MKARIFPGWCSEERTHHNSAMWMGKYVNDVRVSFCQQLSVVGLLAVLLTKPNAKTWSLSLPAVTDDTLLVCSGSMKPCCA